MNETNELNASVFEGHTQFRIARLQLFNWGTFSGSHDIEVSPRGYLFVGASGSGKSTLLDAMVTLLLPQPEYNAAAHEGERGRRSDRSVMSYVRGAWSSATEYEPSGRSRSVVRYLREGSTFSVVALTLFDAVGAQYTLMLVAYVKGRSTDENSVIRQFMIAPGDVTLSPALLKEFARTDFDFKALKRRLPTDLKSFTTFTAYSAAFSALFGIRDKAALKLLAKAQSAKNLGDLNTFLRTFMLDEPKTFETADRLVDEFGELSDAHRAVVEARKQHEILEKARSALLRAQHEERDARLRDEEARATPAWKLRFERDIVERELPRLKREAAESEAALANAESAAEDAKNEVRRLEQLHYRAGGEAVANLTQTLEHRRDAVKRVEKLRLRVEKSLAQCGEKVPDEERTWVTLSEEMKALLRARESAEVDRMKRRDEAVAAEAALERELSALTREIAAMRSRPTNIPSNLATVRRRMADALTLDEKRLPFAGELFEVKPEEALWQGAIERATRDFALTMLVSAEDFPALEAYVAEHDSGECLRILRVEHTDHEEPAFRGEAFLSEKVNFATGPWRSAVALEFAERFPHRCVDTLEAFERADSAVMPSGLVKTRGRLLTKDDSTALDDRRSWVTGFSNASKLALYVEEAERTELRKNEIARTREALDAEGRRSRERLAAAEIVTNASWEEVDLLGACRREAEADEALKAVLESNSELKSIESQLVTARAREETAGRLLIDRTVEAKEKKARLVANESRLTAILREAEKLVADAIDPAVYLRLDARLPASVRLPMAERDLERAVDAVKASIADANRLGAAEAACAQSETCAQFALFRSRYPARASAWDTAYEAAPEYMAYLEGLERDGLPKFERRFRELLETQSLQNFIELASQLTASRRSIFDRMAQVNASLSTVAFSRLETGDTHLRIEINDRRIAEVEDFRRALRSILEGAWESLAPEEADARFERIGSLVERMGSADPEAQRWRSLVLDVRNHVEFSAVEYDDENRVVETYLSGAGKSGGQRQKLTTTCLAAALRYQLGRSATGLPVFAPVLLDEAFDKADSEFTDISMNIFNRFGFQMIVATPEKAVYTLEPYIGGASLVTIADRRRSGVIAIAYDPVKKELDWEDAVPENDSPARRSARRMAELNAILNEIEAEG